MSQKKTNATLAEIRLDGEEDCTCLVFMSKEDLNNYLYNTACKNWPEDEALPTSRKATVDYFFGDTLDNSLTISSCAIVSSDACCAAGEQANKLAAKMRRRQEKTTVGSRE